MKRDLLGRILRGGEDGRIEGYMAADRKVVGNCERELADRRVVEEYEGGRRTEEWWKNTRGEGGVASVG